MFLADAQECPDAEDYDAASWRSQYFELDMDVEYWECDRAIDEKWYRFKSLGGVTIPNTCVEPYHCGTKHPIWMKGKLFDAYKLSTIDLPIIHTSERYPTHGQKVLHGVHKPQTA